MVSPDICCDFCSHEITAKIKDNITCDRIQANKRNNVKVDLISENACYHAVHNLLSATEKLLNYNFTDFNGCETCLSHRRTLIGGI
jgi:hypothetical protein